VKRKLHQLIEKWFSGFLPYQVMVGGVRYYRATQGNRYKPGDFAHYGKNVSIKPGAVITAPERLYLGDNVGISTRVYINAVGGCHIGRGCQLAADVIILTVEHQHTGGEALPYDYTRLVKPVYIEDYVWMGMRASIIPGVRIGEGAIIGMGSVVLEDVPPLAIVIGNPAKILTYRSRPDFDRLKQAGVSIDPNKELPLLRVPPITRRKYKNEIKELGFDISGGQEFFYYDKRQPRGKRLMPAEGKTANLKPNDTERKM
jgi:acetyltransferase-like isoleucine patch superfamily enzyme